MDDSIATAIATTNPTHLHQIHTSFHHAHHHLSTFLSSLHLVVPENSLSSANVTACDNDGEPMQVGGDDEAEEEETSKCTIEKVEVVVFQDHLPPYGFGQRDSMKKISNKEEIEEDPREQGSSSRVSPLLKTGTIPMNEKLKISTLTRPISNVKPVPKRMEFTMEDIAFEKYIERIVEGGFLETPFSNEEYLMVLILLFAFSLMLVLRRKISVLCLSQDGIQNGFPEQLLDKYKLALIHYVSSEIAPSIRQKDGPSLLRELIKQWENYQKLVRWLKELLLHLDFNLSISAEILYIARKTVFTLTEQGRAVNEIHITWIKDIVKLFLEIGMAGMLDLVSKNTVATTDALDALVTRQVRCYKRMFEREIIGATARYYRKRAIVWIDFYSCQEYMQKAEECLQMEKDKVTSNLPSITEKRYLKRVQHELLVTHASEEIFDVSKTVKTGFGDRCSGTHTEIKIKMK
ncbi:hypothetical protein RIF29_23777 [Crotalaria pallida]|uniref:Cullin N-terminal domain-containing protein n=1 Tax=Crotalaria pallida TaxID=3830 RepID=A0AAN9FB47_CROPI